METRQQPMCPVISSTTPTDLPIHCQTPVLIHDTSRLTASDIAFFNRLAELGGHNYVVQSDVIEHEQYERNSTSNNHFLSYELWQPTSRIIQDPTISTTTDTSSQRHNERIIGQSVNFQNDELFAPNSIEDRSAEITGRQILRNEGFAVGPPPLYMMQRPAQSNQLSQGFW